MGSAASKAVTGSLVQGSSTALAGRAAWGAAAVSIVLWAMAFPAIRISVTDLDPMTLTGLRLMVASIALAVSAPLFRLTVPRMRDLPLIVLSGLLGMAGYQLLLNLGEQSVTAATAALLIAASPAYSVLLAALVLKEPLARRRCLGIGVAVVGSILIAVGGGGRVELRSGTVVLLGAALAYGSYHVAHKPLLSRYSAPAVACYATWSATIVTIPLLARAPAAVAQAGTSAISAAIFLGIGPSAIAFVCWAYAIHRLGVSAATTSLYLTPALALPLSALWIGDMPRPVELIGGALAISGVGIANRRRRTGDEPASKRSNA
ncbi:DMT family transporter [Kribbella sp. VKM Ac-2566]|uniref:DMT family transporter n=1 Tax=Kribbella sp. VKM Ac-2566 TaxID=2512218 RepID=UPI0010ECE8F7|nr:DMT family transporter [Kribbella sp. VKM Ac-2566]TDX08300.1 drug/metabolite transporter (DMT)-like permease [Kribbella sp. VKM Ac-2566]